MIKVQKEYTEIYHIKFQKGMNDLSNIKHPCVMVCVTQQETCSRLIEAGARIANENNLPLSVISVFKESSGMDANNGDALENLFSCAQKYGASMNVYFNDSPALVVAVAAKKNHATTLVTGFPAEGSSGFIARIHEILPELPITMVDSQSNEYKIVQFDKEEIEEARKLSTSLIH